MAIAGPLMPLRVEWSGSRLYKFIHSHRRASSSRYDIYVRSRAKSFDLIPATSAASYTDRRATTSTGLTSPAHFRGPITSDLSSTTLWLPYDSIRRSHLAFYIDHSYTSLLSPILSALRNCRFESTYKLTFSTSRCLRFSSLEGAFTKAEKCESSAISRHSSRTECRFSREVPSGTGGPSAWASRARLWWL